MASEKLKRKFPAPPVAPTSTPFLDRLLAAVERRATLVAIALVLLATVRIVATYSVFSHTNDEPAHIGCGMEWLDKHVYEYEVQHPPLARLAVSIGPYLLGAHSVGKTGILGMFLEGLEILYQGNHYDQTLAAARAGVLPFFWLACFVVYLWAKRDFGPAAAVLALFFFTFLPPVLAHAGLATTDMALTAGLAAAFLSGRLWLERPTVRSGAIFGLCGAIAVLSKFSSLAFFAAAVLFTVVAYAAAGQLRFEGLARAVRDRLPSLGVAVAVAAALVWAIYRFSFGSIDGSPRVPAPEFFRGIMSVIEHNRGGHPSYMLGQVSPTGFRSFYFVVLAFKTPIALLILTGFGIAFLKARWKAQPAWMLPVAYGAGVLAVALFSHINIGVRHILPIYTGMSILAAGGVLWLAENSSRLKWATGVAAILLGWYAVVSVLSHPDYLPYFNEFAGSHPEKILVDSDLDWGQDMKRLMTRLEAGRAKVLTLTSIYFIYKRPEMPIIRFSNPDTPFVGWNAVSLSAWKQLRFGEYEKNPDRKFWPDRIAPQEIIGKSIYLWYFPPSSGLPLE